MSLKKWIKKKFYQGKLEPHLVTELEDVQQSFWSLSTIQLTGLTSLPLLATSVMILKDSSFFSATLTIILSNIILWILRYSIICLSCTGRKNTIEIIQEYMGVLGKYVLSIVIVLATFAWFSGQTTIGINALISLLHPNEGPEIDLFIQGSIILGVLSTILCSGGMIWLKWLSLIAFPILIFSFLVVFFTVPHELFEVGSKGITLSGLTLALGSSLGVTADLPTFFRHSRSKNESLKALAFIQIFSLFFAVGALYLSSIIKPWEGINNVDALTNGNQIFTVSLFLLIFISVICANVSNVYAGSVGWEVWAPKSLVGKKEYLLFGLGLTSSFIFFSNMFDLEIMLEKTDAALVNLCIVLIFGYLIHLVFHRLPTYFEKNMYFIAWFTSLYLNFMEKSSMILEVGSIFVIMVIGLILNKLYSLVKVRM